MVHRRNDRPECRAATLQPIGDQAKRNRSLPLQELAKETLRCTTVAPQLNEDIDHVSVLIHGTPQILPFTVDPDENFGQEPCISESTLSSLQTLGTVEPELRAPPVDCRVGHCDSPFGEQIFDISEADTESVVEPDGMTDDFDWTATSVIAGSDRFHRASLSVMGPS